MKRRRWLKWTAIVLLSPVLLFVLLMAALYAPPLQDFLRRKAVVMASEATGMDIGVERIDLRFPLDLRVSGVQVVQPSDSLAASQMPDTLLRLDRLDVHIQAAPLLRGQVEVDGVTLQGVEVNSAGLIDGMSLSGRLGRFHVESHGVDLTRDSVTINTVQLSDTRLSLVLADTTATADADTTGALLPWKFVLHSLRLDNVAVDLRMPLDSLALRARLGEAVVEDAEADLAHEAYVLKHFRLSDTSVGYDQGYGTPAEGFDPAHIALRGVQVGIDSVRYCGRNLNAVIRQLALDDRSGLSVTALTGCLRADSSLISIPSLRLQTPHSEVSVAAHTYWELVEMPTTGRLSLKLDARVGKQDVLLFAGELPQAFKDAYPFRPFTLRAGTDGNLRQMQLSHLSAELPGAFRVEGKGGMFDVTDSLSRRLGLDLTMQTGNLNFLTSLTGEAPDGSLQVPDSMTLGAHLRLEGSRCTARLALDEAGGTLDVDAAYDLADASYEVDLLADSLRVDHFLPQDSIYLLCARLSARGRGFDPLAHGTHARARLELEHLQYGAWDIASVDLHASLREALAAVRLSSDNALLRMKANAALHLDRKYLDGRASLAVADVGLHELGLVPRPLEQPFAFDLQAEARRDSIKLHLGAGDMDLRFKARSTLRELLDRSGQFAEVLARQVDNRQLDHAELRRMLPSAGLSFRAGRDNPVSRLLATQGIGYDRFGLDFGFTPDWGINGRTAVEGLRVDSLRLDTVFFAIRQDTTRMRLQGGVVNGPDNPQFVFSSTLTGEIRSEDAGLTVEYRDADGETGILLGVNARPLFEGHGKGNGVLLSLMPAEPVVAYRKFRFVDGRSLVYLHRDMHVYANVDMESDDGLRFRLMSDPRDTVSLQNINVELSRFRLEQLSSVLPYLPQLGGLFSAKAHYVQTERFLQFSATAGVDSLCYEGRTVGDVGLEADWVPADEDTHFLRARLDFDGSKVLDVDGKLQTGGDDGQVDVAVRLLDFPLRMGNAFLPEGLASLSGDVDGELSVGGTLGAPVLGGEMRLDSVSAYVDQIAARYWLGGKEPIRIADNVVRLDGLSMYTTSRNPFSVDGTVDFHDLARPVADLRVRASNYTLLDVPRTRKGLVYGKVVVDVTANAQGPLDALVVRGNMNLLGTTDVTYVLTDSPLTVEDRLTGLVDFTSFADTTATAADSVPTLSLGGMDMLMTVHIDDAVRLRADLSADRSKFVELEGGGDLSLQYTPQGDMTLNGRYTLTGGIMKYSLPVIPLKEFQIASGSYVDWRGNLMEPTLNLTATERVRTSVSNGGDDGGTRSVDFDVSITINGSLESPGLAFDLAAPNDATVQNELQAMGAEERSKQAIAMLATGIYLNSGVKGGGLDMGSALNSVLQNQINSLAGSALESVNASFSMGVEDRTSAETGDKQTDYSFRYSQRLFNDRVQIVIGGKVSTGANATNSVESFIDNISLEYRLDQSGTRYIRVFHDKNYESILDGEITETGVGLVLRRKMDRLGELFIFRRKKQ